MEGPYFDRIVFFQKQDVNQNQIKIRESQNSKSKVEAEAEAEAEVEVEVEAKVKSLRKSISNLLEGLAGGQGFEPRLMEPESIVLPLDDPPTTTHCKFQIEKYKYQVPSQ